MIIKRMTQSALNSHGWAWVFGSQGSQLHTCAQLDQGVMQCSKWPVQAGQWPGCLTTFCSWLSTGTKKASGWSLESQAVPSPTISAYLQDSYFNNAFNSILPHRIPRGRWNPLLSRLDPSSPHACQHFTFAIFIFIVIHADVHTLPV